VDGNPPGSEVAADQTHYLLGAVFHMPPTESLNPAEDVAPECPGGRHGTAAAYSRGCRCPAATRAATLRRKRWQLDTQQGRPHTIPSVGTVRRIRALMAIGWSKHAIGAHMGVSKNAVAQLLDRQRVTVRLATDVDRLYQELAHRPGPAKITATKTRLAGWAPPLAWDEDDIDDPAARPAVGWQRDPSAPLVVEVEDVEHLRRFGMSDEQIERDKGVAPAAVFAASARRRLAEETRQHRLRDDMERVAAAVQAALDRRPDPLGGLTRRESALALLALHERSYSDAAVSRLTGRAASTVAHCCCQGRKVRAELAEAAAQQSKAA
jgi:hypothetical protein